MAYVERNPIPNVSLLNDPLTPSELTIRAEGPAYVLVGPDGGVRHRVAGRTAEEIGQQLAGVLRQEQAALALASLENPAHPFAVEFGFAGDANTFRVGDTLAFRVRSARDGCLTIVDMDPAGKVTVVFPNAYQRDGRVAAGQE